MLTNEQVIAAQKAQIEAFHELTTHYVSSVEKLTELNLRLAKDCLQDSNSNGSKILDSMAGQGQQATSTHLPVLEPLLPRMTEYWKHLLELATSMGHEFNEILASHAESVRKKLIETVDKDSGDEPQGADPEGKAVKVVVESNKPTAVRIREALQKAEKSN